MALRFWKYVVAPPDNVSCWLWRGAKNRTMGHGKIRPNGQGVLTPVYAHRVAYEALRGPIAPGMVIDHLCRVPNCVNPFHLEVVSQRQNVMRGQTIPARNVRKTHCIRGHEFTTENIYIPPKHPTHRECRVCLLMREQQRVRPRKKLMAPETSA